MTFIPGPYYCKHCRVMIWDEHFRIDHPELCCDCFDLSCGMSLADLNRERAAAGRPPIERPWPGRRADGEARVITRIRWRVMSSWRRLTNAISEVVGYRRW